jgi:starvation-inducible DNA-binding protein
MASETVTTAAFSVTQALNVLQSDTMVLYQKLRSYHWNVTGQQFFMLHELFEKLYREVADVGDALAERALALGALPMRTLEEQLSIARLKEDRTTPDSRNMVRSVLVDLELLNASLRDLARQAQRDADVATTNLADGIADRNEKTAWMLRACLKG